MVHKKFEVWYWGAASKIPFSDSTQIMRDIDVCSGCRRVRMAFLGEIPADEFRNRLKKFADIVTSGVVTKAIRPSIVRNKPYDAPNKIEGAELHPLLF